MNLKYIKTTKGIDLSQEDKEKLLKGMTDHKTIVIKLKDTQ